MRRAALAVIAPIALVTLAALLLMWPSGEIAAPEDTGVDQVGGRVVTIESEACAETLPDEVNGCGTATVLLDGADEEIEVALPNGPGAPLIAAGDDVVVIVGDGPDGVVHAIVDHQRATQLWLLAVAFALALVAFGRWRGVTALAGLVVTFLLLTFFVVPAILAGESPLMVAIVGSAAIMLLVLYLTHGAALATTVAVLGTLGSLVLTGLLSALAVSSMHLSGITDDLSTSVGVTHQVDMRGLLLAGIVIGSLGVLDDVTVTQSATVAELARANPAYGGRELYVAAARVGRAHIASVVNTIVLAYAGSSLPLLILIVANSDSLGAVVTDQLIAQEIVRSAVATLGLVAAVPLTTALAALTFRAAAEPAVEAESPAIRPGRRRRS